MLKINEFSFGSWLHFAPFIFAFKEMRNDFFLKFYLSKKPQNFSNFIADTQYLKAENVAVVVAFEQPWALNWLLLMASKNLKNTTLLVFDNSRNLNIRQEIELVCRKHNVQYLPLPVNNTKHVNRSHGMAMSWIYENVIKKIKPNLFAFIDHDLIPVAPLDLSECIGKQNFFGRLGGNNPKYWSLWAGYCVFRYSFLEDKKINFLYDFSRGLDTGGRNWNSLYSVYDKSKLVFANQEYKTIYMPDFNQGVSVEFIDGKWMHMGRISYRDGFKDRFAFFDALAKELEKNSSWQRLL